MSVNRPYRRTFRQFIDGSYTEGGRSRYVVHPLFAQSSEHYVRAFLLLQKDLKELFDYVEPAENNLKCYSYRIHSLLLRTCVEVEANCKAILKENGYGRAGDWNMNDYRKINTTHLLSDYEVKVPNWTGGGAIRSPFATWGNDAPLPWYQAYNTSKHDRHEAFHQATFEQLIDACCGLLVLLSAQFGSEDFSSGPILFAVMSEEDDGLSCGIGDYFRVKFPIDWPPELRYEFDWQKLKAEKDPFQTYDYSEI